MGKYDKRGVSADKKEVHEAIKNIDKGLFPNAFCKVIPDFVGNDREYVNLMHADTAGTKTSLAYLYWRETGDVSVWKGIVQDALVMNLDDLACVGAFNNIIVSSTIGRNKNLITGEVIKTIIEAAQEFSEKMKEHGINIQMSGGETADVGDIVRTIDVGYTAFARVKKSEIIDINIRPGDVIVGIESSGRSTYEEVFNSGIGSNGLTFARHEALSNDYALKYPESFDPNIDPEYVYTGKLDLKQKSYIDDLNIGQLLLSPTRTYLPLIKKILDKGADDIHGIIHCTGGGQTKVSHFIKDLHIIKNNLFEVPAVFRHIQEQSDADWQEMYKVFNMGHRLEFYVPESKASEIIEHSAKFNLNARIIGHVEFSKDEKVTIDSDKGIFTY
jgi:phosphoribosylformylglycinamidine cyclo-ligase